MSLSHRGPEAFAGMVPGRSTAATTIGAGVEGVVVPPILGENTDTGVVMPFDFAVGLSITLGRFLYVGVGGP